MQERINSIRNTLQESLADAR